MKKSVWILLLFLFALSAAGFVYTFVQPRYPATIVSVGRARTVTRYTKHRRRTHTVVPLTVTFTDGHGDQQTAEVDYIRPDGPLAVGQQITITQSFNGWINAPFTGLRIFCGFVGAAIGVFLLFMWIDRKKT